jgi:hypothetical protein
LGNAEQIKPLDGIVCMIRRRRTLNSFVSMAASDARQVYSVLRLLTDLQLNACGRNFVLQCKETKRRRHGRCSRKCSPRSGQSAWIRTAQGFLGHAPQPASAVSVGHLRVAGDSKDGLDHAHRFHKGGAASAKRS